jgi:hypothetical protein
VVIEAAAQHQAGRSLGAAIERMTAVPRPDWEVNRKIAAVAVLKLSFCDSCRVHLLTTLKNLGEEAPPKAALTEEDHWFLNKFESMRENSGDGFLDRLGSPRVLEKTCKRMLGEKLSPKIQ